MKEGTKKFTTSLESSIGNDIEGVFEPTSPSIIYYEASGEGYDTDENVLHYGDKFVHAKPESFDKAYLEAFNNYIGSEIALDSKYAIPV